MQPVPARQLVRIHEGLPDWWFEGGNQLWAYEGALLPTLKVPPRQSPPSYSRISLMSEHHCIKAINMWGSGNLVELGKGAVVEDGTIVCCGGSRITIGAGTLISANAWIDARNGGVITVGPDGLWSSEVRVATDDMHAILDAKTNKRINRRGTTITIERHVWLGMQVVILPGATIGEDSVIGIKSIVSKAIPRGVVAAGIPARVIRTGVSWSHDDLE